ncbi:unnamed protein product [Coffea canephora]|uniref:DH200=94 genomic scaffold, scaffold_5330 n=1 Tax=Coffea canephora TaxID=49390 RepID=A0A068VLG8_COFCA|nr:unnamed protein product [Coffea canephora]
MLMSLFSSFDALCAESFGQKSWAPGASKSHHQQQEEGGSGSPLVVSSERKAAGLVSLDDAGSKNKGKQGNMPSSPEANKSGDHHHRPLQQKRRPRFAVELDGLHCFETIIPY